MQLLWAVIWDATRGSKFINGGCASVSWEISNFTMMPISYPTSYHLTHRQFLASLSLFVRQLHNISTTPDPSLPEQYRTY
jgi:hypothetical protein